MESRQFAEQPSKGFGNRLLSAIREHRRQAKIERLSLAWEQRRVRPVEYGGATTGPGDEAFEEYGRTLGLSEADVSEAYIRARERVAAEYGNEMENKEEQ